MFTVSKDQKGYRTKEPGRKCSVPYGEDRWTALFGIFCSNSNIEKSGQLNALLVDYVTFIHLVDT
jgi:hypothetical protein